MSVSQGMAGKLGIAGLASMAVLMAIAHTAIAQQQGAFPTRPVRYIIPFPPGGSTDPMGRFIASKLTEIWGHSVVVDNRPGGNTVIGTELLARAAPDGYTIGWSGASMFSTPSLIPKLPYDVLRDFAGVATIATGRSVLVLHPSVPANTLQEFVALAKAKPGQLNFGSSGVGTNTHLSGELFNLMAGTQMIHIPYKGSGPVTTDLLAGRLQLSFQVPITVIPFIKAGKLRPIALSGEGRLAALPEVPTFSEAGMAGFGLTSVTAMVAPAKTPASIINKINTDIAAVLAQPSTHEFMTKQGAEPFTSTPQQTATVIREELARYAKIIKGAAIKFSP
ncbi:MAG: tripartite tricarboxylate transporter substrate binding protein [Betaproteobacteria bacterium]|nr:tripartite tricarboxylate transporter substrate binding protein [Betaproteobacteria bacterium]